MVSEAWRMLGCLFPVDYMLPHEGGRALKHSKMVHQLGVLLIEPAQGGRGSPSLNRRVVFIRLRLANVKDPDLLLEDDWWVFLIGVHSLVGLRPQGCALFR